MPRIIALAVSRWMSLLSMTIGYLAAVSAVAQQDQPVLDIASRRELWVDDYLIDRLEGVQLRMHAPQPQEVVLKFDAPWEGIYSGYETIIKDGDRYRMYYRGLPVAKHSLDTEVTCVAESADGIVWTKPKLGLFESNGVKETNIVLAKNRGCHNLAPFIDDNPRCQPSQRYKALGGTGAPGLLAFVSPDGLNWEQLGQEPVITDGAFDSQNNAFWSTSENCYVCYFRVFRDGKRWIARSTSTDFTHWTDPVDMDLDGKPREQLYTNQLAPYSRAPHLYLGFPTRFMPGRRVLTDDEVKQLGTPGQWNYANDCTDIQFNSTRGGNQLKRTFLEAFIRPGLDLQNWTSRASYAVRGVVQTGPHELSMYVKHHAGYPTIHVRRYTIRPDGFVSLNANTTGGRVITKPFRFVGTALYLNMATSAAGTIQVEIQSAEGDSLPGFGMKDCKPLLGDRLEKSVSWGESELADLQGQAIRLCMQLQDADLFAIQFR